VFLAMPAEKLIVLRVADFIVRCLRPLIILFLVIIDIFGFREEVTMSTSGLTCFRSLSSFRDMLAKARRGPWSKELYLLD